MIAQTGLTIIDWLPLLVIVCGLMLYVAWRDMRRDK